MNNKNPKSCTISHPPLEIMIDDKSYLIYGSSCVYPNIKNADIYISLDERAPIYDWEQPWNKNKKNQVHIRYFIDDMGTPKDPQDFDNALNYTIEQLKKENSIHVGCLAGHGRTGLFLSALVHKTMSDILDKNGTNAIEYVRQSYCEKAVETLSQVLYLNANYDIAIPNREKGLFEEFRELLIEETGYTYEQIVKQGLFMSIVDSIDEIELQIDIKNNPNKYQKQKSYLGYLSR